MDPSPVFIRGALEKCIEFKTKIEMTRRRADAEIKQLEDQLKKATGALSDNLACIYIDGGYGVMFYDTKEGRTLIEEADERVGLQVEDATKNDSYDEVVMCGVYVEDEKKGTRDEYVEAFMKDIKSPEEIVEMIKEAAKRRKTKIVGKKRSLWKHVSNK